MLPIAISSGQHNGVCKREHAGAGRCTWEVRGGYGDVVPATMLGQAVGAIVAILGIGMFALPAALIATGFADATGVEGAPAPDDDQLED
jgi:L-aminopeptidase/D-esterase-like protein